MLPLVGLLVLTELLPAFLLGCLRGVAVLPLLPPRLPVGREEDDEEGEEKDKDGTRVGVVVTGAGRREGLGFAATEPEPEPEGGKGAAGLGERDELAPKGGALGLALVGMLPGLAFGLALVGMLPGLALGLGLDFAGEFLARARDVPG